ncbi:MAG: tRNA preQ1(34) S-adenosylmethionine ribosyltransferase-isomerase QueA [Syntrophales bacterium]|nr:tRNA preQ1(34) S-adenosylmethionine ribosyltransferase-isomerase QueA [Syntrophales bacterium]
MTKVTEFDYFLPEELIAQMPLSERDASRMMVVHRDTEEIEHRNFRDLETYLKPGDVLVVNNSRVVPARLQGNKETGGKVDILLVRRLPKFKDIELWEVILKPARRVKPGIKIFFEGGNWGIVSKRLSAKKWEMEFVTTSKFGDFLREYGLAPLPPYIKRPSSEYNKLDKERYQTVYAKEPGSVAAPTAGLHFTNSIIERLKKNGVSIAEITLHVGYGTFSSIEKEHIEDHALEPEEFYISQESANIINSAERVIAVGTTTTRALETAATKTGKEVDLLSGWTDLYIYPGYKFKIVDGLLTNFHLPRSSLYILVCAFAGKSLIEKAYQQAIKEKYRFFSYGDCMLII